MTIYLHLRVTRTNKLKTTKKQNKTNKQETLQTLQNNSHSAGNQNIKTIVSINQRSIFHTNNKIKQAPAKHNYMYLSK